MSDDRRKSAAIRPIAHATHAFYEAKFNAAFTESSVLVTFLGTTPLRNLIPPLHITVPEMIGAFSFAPHLDGETDVYVRKTFIKG